MTDKKRNEFDGIVDLLRNDGSIIINKNLAFEIGLETATVYVELLSKYRYFKKEGMLTDDGYFFNTIDNFRLDTTLPGKRQRKAVEELVELKLIKKDLRGLPPKRHFKPIQNTKRVLKLINNGREKRAELEEKLSTKAAKSKKRYIEGINSANTEKTNTPNKHVNNSNLNYPNRDNTNKTYVEPKKSTVATSIFLSLYKKHTDENHKAVDKKVLRKADDLMRTISQYRDKEEIRRIMNEYFLEFANKDKYSDDFGMPTLNHFIKVIPRYFLEEWKNCSEYSYQ